MYYYKYLCVVVSVQKVLPSSTAVSCETCKMVAGYVENALKDKKTEVNINTLNSWLRIKS